MAKSQRLKGKRGEVEAALHLTKQTSRYWARGHDQDVVCYDETLLHVEVKRREKLNVFTALAQAIKDAKNKIPTVLFRRNHGVWYISLRLSDVERFAREIIRLIDE